MNHCKDCQHWTAPRMVEHGPHGICQKIDMAKEGVDMLAEMNGYDNATLFTMPDFGCVLYAAK